MSKDIIVENVGGKTLITQKLWVEEYDGKIRLSNVDFEGFSGHTTIDTVIVKVEIDEIDTIQLRDRKIEKLNNQIESNRADAAVREDRLKDAIQSLMCLDAQ